MKDLQDFEIKYTTPIYKQIVDNIESAIVQEKLKGDEPLPSIRQLAKRLDVSKESVKKAYGILTRRGLLVGHQGKGYFVRSKQKSRRQKVIILSDKLSPYRQTFLNAFSATAGKSVETLILIHNQDVELLRHYLDQFLGKYDYYIITPHFPRDLETKSEVIRQLSRIPSRQLILADKDVDSLPGNYGAVYQDFDNDVVTALSEVADELRTYSCLDVFTMPNSMYGSDTEFSIARFCDRNNLHASFHSGVRETAIHRHQICIFLNSQADEALFTINEIAKKKNLVIGKDIKLISYNESPLCAILFGGLSTISADFEQMGQLCAQMVKSGEQKKIKCDFRLIRRYTF
ncbi:MAG: GntR family transcriptional regulator [Bacteroidales bacterium]|nr:GntR family transcriptional regulator [Bacteroidales bacterium]